MGSFLFHYWILFLYTAILQTPSSSDVLLVWDIVEDLQPESWQDFAGRLGISADYIDKVHSGWPGQYAPAHVAKSFYRRCLYRVSGDWAARKEGTGSRPRNCWKFSRDAVGTLKRTFLGCQLLNLSLFMVLRCMTNPRPRVYTFPCYILHASSSGFVN